MLQRQTLMMALLFAGSHLACDRTGRDIKIGAVTCLSGEGASFGVSQRQGYELAVEEWNSNGGLLGKRIRLVVADDKGDPAEGATAFTKVIEMDKVVAILSATTSRVTLAGAPIAQSAHIPTITPAATHSRVTATGDYLFRACFTDNFQGGAAANFAFQELQARKVACLYDAGNDYSKGLADSFCVRFKALGGQIVAYEGHRTGVTEFLAQLARIRQGHPDLIYVPDYYGDVALIARQARGLGFHGPLLGGDGWDSPRLVELAGAAINKGYFTCHYAKDEPHPEVQAFVGKFRSRYGMDPDALAVLGYDALNLLLDAIRRAGTTDGAAIRTALAATGMRAVSGLIRFDSQRNPIKQASLVEIREGRQVFRAKVSL